MTLCNMVVEAGGKNGVIPPDATTLNYVEVYVLSCFLVNQFFFSWEVMLRYSFSYIFCRIGHLYPLSQYIVMEMQGTITWYPKFINSGSKYGFLVSLFE